MLCGQGTKLQSVLGLDQNNATVPRPSLRTNQLTKCRRAVGFDLPRRPFFMVIDVNGAENIPRASVLLPKRHSVDALRTDSHATNPPLAYVQHQPSVTRLEGCGNRADITKQVQKTHPSL